VNYVKDINSIATVNTETGELIISKWNGEAYFKIKTTDDPISYRLENEKNILEFEKYQARIYTIEKGIEFDIVLSQKPISNIFNFDIQTKGLKFYKQLPLSEEIFPKEWTVNETHAFNEKGELIAHRPRNIVGSYAIYHESKRDNEYKTGKFGTSLQIEIPQQFLDAAIYPVIIDPSFGNTVEGASGWTIGNDEIFGFEASPTYNGVLDNVSVHIAITNAETSTDKCALFNDSDDSLVSNSETDEEGHVGDGSYNWETWTNSAPKASILASDNYIISIFHKNTTAGNAVVHYDNGANNYGHRDLGSTYPNFPDPVVWTWQDVKYFSIYANYTRTLTYYLDADNLEMDTLEVGSWATVSFDLETNSTPAFYWIMHNGSGVMENQTAAAWINNGTVTFSFTLPDSVGYPLGIQGFANTTAIENGTVLTIFILESDMAAFTENLWITVIIFMFLVIIGYVKKDAIIHLIAVVVGFIMAMAFIDTAPYLGYSLVTVCLYLAYYALMVEWNEEAE
jgi:hypothetical protein